MAPAENTSSAPTGGTGANGTILVGIDGSPNSEHAFDEALALAQAKGMGIDLAGAFTFPFGYVDPYNTTALSGRDEFRRIVENRVRQAADPLIDRANAAGVEVHLDIAEGDAAGVLTRWSEKVDLAVVGKRGRSPVAGRFMGSVSSSFVSHSHCPVLVVPEKWKGHSHDPAEAPPVEGASHETEVDVRLRGASHDTDEKPAGRVGAGLDFSGSVVVAVDPGDKTNAVVDEAVKWAKEAGSALTLVSAVTLDTETGTWIPNPVQHNLVEAPRVRAAAVTHLEEITERLRESDPGLDVRWRFFDGSPGEVIGEATRTAELVVVGSRGRGGFVGLLLGSVSRAVLNRAVCPVLVVPRKKR